MCCSVDGQRRGARFADRIELLVWVESEQRQDGGRGLDGLGLRPKRPRLRLSRCWPTVSEGF
jgi:hypothetical protein